MQWDIVKDSKKKKERKRIKERKGRKEGKEGGGEGGKKTWFFSYKQGRDLAGVLTGTVETNPIILVQPPLNITDGK